MIAQTIEDVMARNIRLVYKFVQANIKIADKFGGPKEMESQLMTAYFMAVKSYVNQQNPKKFALSTMVFKSLKWEIIRLENQREIIRTPAKTKPQFQSYKLSARNVRPLHGGEVYDPKLVFEEPQYTDESEIKAKLVKEILGNMDTRSRRLVELYFGLKRLENEQTGKKKRSLYGGATLDQCAAVAQVTTERARQLIANALAKIKRKKSAFKLAGLADF